MLPAPNLQSIAHQTQEFAKHTKNQHLGLVFQTVSMVSMAVLGVGAAVHLLREMLRHPHQQHPDHKDGHSNHAVKHGHRRYSEQEHSPHEEEDTMTRHVRQRTHHGHGRGH